MEFLSLEAMTRLVSSAGWRKADVLRAIEQGQLVALQVSSPYSSKKKWAILHPGVQFLDYIRSQEARMPHIAILSERDVSVILDKSRSYVRWLVHKKKLGCLPHAKGKGSRRFSPEDVRRFIIRSSGRDPKQRCELTAEVLVAWFWRMMKLDNPDPIKRVDEEMRWLDEMPEPERSMKIEEMMRVAEEARGQLEVASRKTPEGEQSQPMKGESS